MKVDAVIFRVEEEFRFVQNFNRWNMYISEEVFFRGVIPPNPEFQSGFDAGSDNNTAVKLFLAAFGQKLWDLIATSM